MTAQRKRRGRKPATILRRLDTAVRNARTYLVDIKMPGQCDIQLLVARELVAELGTALRKGRAE